MNTRNRMHKAGRVTVKFKALSDLSQLGITDENTVKQWTNPILISLLISYLLTFYLLLNNNFAILITIIKCVVFP
jgi:hypothetical protein